MMELRYQRGLRKDMRVPRKTRDDQVALECWSSTGDERNIKAEDETTKYSDWRADLQKYGFAVVKGAIPHDRAVRYQDTWHKDNLPVQTPRNTFDSYGISHEKFMWDARMEPGVLNAFATIWGTDELLVSFDSLNVTFPNRKDIPKIGAWEHLDQSPLRRGLHCVQGFINLSPSGPEDGGLVVYPGSHALNDDFFDTQTGKSTWSPIDRYIFSREQLVWFNARGIRPLKVNADVGDLILWDSRTIHYGAEPQETSNQIRTIIYAAYTPARLASPEQIALKKEAFQKYGGTTHWPHDNIIQRETKTYLEDGTRDPRDRD
ncbi:phytanoyl-CoA dioxygenase [Xylariales sp. AK1849]|nr:phytanoyl-CoA dioxygenase [Xylariales sp. AK1849]